MVSDCGTRLAIVAEKWSGENRTNRTGGAATAVEQRQKLCTIHRFHTNTTCEACSSRADVDE